MATDRLLLLADADAAMGSLWESAVEAMRQTGERVGCRLYIASADDVTAAFVAQASRATLKQLIAIGEAANDEKDQRLMADLEPEPDFAGANVDAICRLFVAQCRADGRARTVRALQDRVRAETRPDSGDIDFGVAVGFGAVFEVLGLSALLEPEAVSEERKLCEG